VAALPALLFSGTWMLLFLRDQLGFIAMFSASSYYFSSEGDLQVGSAGVMEGVKLAHCTHFGSIALGSLLKAAISSVRYTVETLEEDNAVVQCLLSCVLGCVEGAIEMLDRTALANMAISGDSFCKSAWAGFMISLRHLSKFFYSQLVAGSLVGMGIFMIALLNTGFAFVIAQYAFNNDTDVTGLLPTAMLIGTGVVCFLSFLVSVALSSRFLGLFDEAVLATLQCVAIDMDFNNGHPKYGSASFQTNIQIILDRDVDTETKTTSY